MPQAHNQRPAIFICYRRDDSAGYAGRLYDRLSAYFGDGQIFMDLDQIEPGEDFVQVIEDAVGSCGSLLALIGRNWVEDRDKGARRLDNPGDFVRLEIATALARGVQVIPVLVQGAQMPSPQDLPEELLPLSRRQAFELSDRRWRHDVEQLIGRLERVLGRRAQQEEAAQSVRPGNQSLKQSDEKLNVDPPLRVLHLSDLHFGEGDDVRKSLRPLVADIKDASGGLGFERLDYLVISGDLTNRATPPEFEAAQQFTSGLIEAFELTALRCVVVPGNHDLSWDEPVYEFKLNRQVEAARLKEGTYKQLGSDGYLLRDDARYRQRFGNFSRFFYHPLFQLEYPLAPADQGIPYLFPETGLQFLAFNSAWEIDEHFQTRAGINEAALTRALEKADQQVAAQMSGGAQVLRVAVWHHPVTGNEKIVGDAFMQQLWQANVRLVLHGHVHEDRAALVGYMHPKQIRVVGAGSFGAPARERPESTPRLYNLLEIARDHSSIKVHTRCLRKGGGAWEGWAVWEGDEPTAKKTFYPIGLS